MKRSLLFLVLSLVLCGSLFAQQFVDLNLMGEGYFRVKANPDKTIDGSSYLYDNWHSGSVKMIGVDELKVDSLNFDTYSNSLLFYTKGTTYCVSDKHKLEYFFIGDSKFLNLRSASYPESFFEILSDGNVIKLTQLHKCVIVEGKPTDGIDPGRNDRYKIISEYYIINKFGAVELFMNTKKDLLELMADKKIEMEKYIKDNKLNIKRKIDLVNIFSHYNTLSK